MTARLRLTRGDGTIYLDRWGYEFGKYGPGIFLHRMDGPDPGLELHDHPWTFASFILTGGYLEQRTSVRDAVRKARYAEDHDRQLKGRPPHPRGEEHVRRVRRWKVMRLDECHRIVGLRSRTWTLVVHGWTKRTWGFYTPDGWMRWKPYESTHYGLRRGLDTVISNVDQPTDHEGIPNR